MPCDRFIEVVGAPVWRSIPVTNRRLCPENAPGSSRRRAAQAFTIKATHLR
jgi:hypothetical protein